mmetsp:Transcript_45015/g.143401  ORF Transcript_45015/g.143401 Transcript_45015/m.143401 type:complete len:263 (-) Transcript_45015:405-1193(-)
MEAGDETLGIARRDQEAGSSVPAHAVALAVVAATHARDPHDATRPGLEASAMHLLVVEAPTQELLSVPCTEGQRVEHGTEPLVECSRCCGLSGDARDAELAVAARPHTGFRPLLADSNKRLNRLLRFLLSTHANCPLSVRCMCPCDRRRGPEREKFSATLLDIQPKRRSLAVRHLETPRDEGFAAEPHRALGGETHRRAMKHGPEDGIQLGTDLELLDGRRCPGSGTHGIAVLEIPVDRRPAARAAPQNMAGGRNHSRVLLL